MSRIARLGGRTFGGLGRLPLQRNSQEVHKPSDVEHSVRSKRMAIVTVKHRQGLLLHSAIIL
jgi:hypothetical protein